jgi:hypothetical protein
MQVDKATFLLLTGAIAAGTLGCELVTERTERAPAQGQAPASPPPQAAAPPPAESEAERAARKEELRKEILEEERAAAARACSDDVGAPEECPVAVGPSEEGVCNGGVHWASKRCADFKTAFKPKVAQAAVACLRNLKGAASCDPMRATQCGHQALMMACPDGEVPESHASVTSAALSERPLSETSTLAEQCDAIVKASVGAVPGTSFADCHRTLSGMTEVGRANMVQCMKTHAAEKGLLGCEATAPPPPTPPIQ